MSFIDVSLIDNGTYDFKTTTQIYDEHRRILVFCGRDADFEPLIFVDEEYCSVKTGLRDVTIQGATDAVCTNRTRCRL